MGITVADLRVKFGADLGDLEKGADKANSIIKNVGKDTSGVDALNGKLKNIGNDANPSGSGGLFGSLFSSAASVAIGDLLSSAIKSAAQLGWDGAKAIFNAGLGEIKTTISVGIEFEQDLANIKADLTNLNPNLVSPEGIFDPVIAKQLSDTISRIALDPHLIVDMKEAAQTAQVLTRYGFSLQDIDKGALQSAVLLQNATGSTYTLAAETLAKYAAIYKLNPTELPKAVSEISATISKGGFRDLNDYRYGLVNMTGAAQAFGVSALEMNTILAVSNHQFSSGRTGGTAIRTMFEHLVPSSDKARDAMRALNLTFFDAQGKYVGFAQTIQRLRTAFAGLSQEESEKKLQAIFGATGSKEVRELINETTDAMLEQTQSVIDNADAAQAASQRTDTLSAKLSTLGDQLGVLRTKFFSEEFQRIFFPPVEALTNYLSSLGPTFEQASRQAMVRIKPAIDVLMNVIKTGKLPNFAAEFNTKFGKIKVLKMDDLFSFDIGDIGATFQKGLANFHIGDFLRFDRSGDDSYTIKLSDFITFENDLSSQIRTLDITKYFHLVMDTGANKTHISINDFVVFDEEKGKRSLEIGKYFHLSVDTGDGKRHISINDFVILDETTTARTLQISKYFKVAQDTIKGTVDLQVGTFKTTIDKTKIDIAVGAVSLILTNISTVLSARIQGVSANLQTALAIFSGNKVQGPQQGPASFIPQGFGEQTTGIEGFLAKIKNIPNALSVAFTGLTLPDLGQLLKNKVTALFPPGFDFTLPNLGQLLKDKVKGLFPADFSLELPSVDGLKTTFTSFTTIVTNLNTSLKGLTASDGGITKLQTLFLTGVKNFSDSIAGIDANKTASVALSFSGSVRSVLDMFTTLSGLGSLELTTETQAISDIAKSILGLATSFTTGLDAQGIADSASKFVATYVDKLSTTLSSADVPGVADAASNLVLAISGKFKEALSGDGPAEIGKSLGGLASEIVIQLGAAFNDKTLATNLGESFSNIIVGITNGLKGVFEGFNAADTAKDVNIQGALGGFVTNFLTGMGTALAKADFSNVFKGFIDGLLGSLSGLKELNQAIAEDANATGWDKIQSRMKVFQAFLNLGSRGFDGDPVPLSGNKSGGGGGFGGAGDSGPKYISPPSKDYTPFVVPADGLPVKIQAPVAITADTPIVVKTLPYPTINASDSSIRGTANDYSSWLSQLNTFSAKLTSIPPVKVETIPPIVVPTIPPVVVPPIPPVQVIPPPPIQIPQPVWLPSLLGWHPTVAVQGPVQGAQPFFRGFASGTKFAPGGWSWVGEEGPELVRLPQGAQVMSHPNSMAAIGQLSTGNTDGRPWFGAPYASRPMPTIGAPQLAPMTKSLASIERSSAATAISSKTTATRIAVKAPMTDAQLALARQRAAAAQQGIPANAALAKTTAAVQRAGEEIAKNFKGTVEELKSALQNIPGLFHASPVTQQQMDMAKLGIPQNFADDWLRRLTDEVVNGVQWSDVDIKDAATRAGLDPSLPAKAILDMVTAQWNDNSFFAGGKNTDLINMDAIKAQLAQQQAQASGKDALMALFGIQSEQVGQQALAVGTDARTKAQQGFAGLAAGATGATGGAAPQVDIMSMLLGNGTTNITPEMVTPLVASFSAAVATALSGGGGDDDKQKAGFDFGAQFAAAINTSLTTSDALATTGQAILKAITDSWKTIKDVDFISGLTSAMNTQIATSGAIDALNSFGGKVAKLIKDGIDEYFRTAALADSIANSMTNTTTATPIGHNATGTSYWRGGLTWVGERGAELISLPRGSQVYNNSQAMAMAGAGATGGNGGDTYHIHMHNEVNNKLDEEALLYRLMGKLKRRSN